LRSPINLIGKSVGQVFFGQVSQYYDSPKKIKSLFLRVNFILFFIGILISIILLVIKTIIFDYILGDEWGEAVHIFEVLTLLIAFQLSIGPLSEVLNIVNRQELRLIWDIVRVISLIVIFT